MNFSFYIYGMPSGYNQYPADNNSVAFQEFAQENATESQLTVCRKGQLVYYAYLRKLQEKSSQYLGFCLVFNGIYCHNPKKIFSLFDKAFDDVLMKGELLKFEKGKCLYTVNKFAEKQIEIERIKSFFKKNLEDDFSRDFTPIPPSFKVGAGSYAISIKESEGDILAAIAEYEAVHISNNEKSLSELERTHKLLTELYAEKQKLQNNYSKLAAQKKQYKVVLLLCLVLIGCAVGLLVFNSSLKSRDSQIKDLNVEVLKKNQNIEKLNQNVEKLNQNIVQLRSERDSLTNKNSSLISNLRKATAEKELLSSANEQLNSEIYDKNNTIRSLESQNNQCHSENIILQSKNNNLSSDVERYKKYEPQTYKAVSRADYYYKHKCNGAYKKTDCYSNSGDYVRVYITASGYGLTEYGWVKMSSLSK